MSAEYQHLGWIVSPYSQKTLAYLKYKHIPHTDRAPGAVELINKIPKRVGKAIMPTLQTPEGEWWQDSTDIIDKLEQRFPECSITPTGNKQRITAHLLELHGDEWLVLSALHYRWSRPTSADFIVGEFARLGVPWLPKTLGRIVGKRIRNMMKSYLPRFGIVGKTTQGLEAFTENLLQQLETHFTRYSFLLGNRPCVGDFALFGQIYAHLYRDPGSKPLFNNTPNLVCWIERMLTPEATAQGDFLENDDVPATLNPILKNIFAEQFVFSHNVVKAIQEYADKNPQAKRISRIVGITDFTVGGITGQRSMFSFVQWKMQRVVDAFHNTDNAQQEDVSQWLRSINGDALMTINIKHRLKREDNSEVFDR